MASLQLSQHFFRLVVAHLLHQAGFENVVDSAHFGLADILARYIDLLATKASQLAQHQGRTVTNFDDIATAFDTLDIDVEELTQFCESALQIGAEDSCM